MLAGSIAASNLVGTDIATLGTVTAGTLSTGAVIAGVTITVGSDATGDLYYRNASGIFTRLGIGSAAQVLTVAGGLPSWAASSGLSGTGAVDNAVLRADGTGGATLQSSAFTIADLATASPNNTVNNVSMAPTGGTTNVSVSIVPKGTGAFCLAVPDGTSAGGNARGANAVDLQATRTAANQVASGDTSILIGTNGRASGQYSVAIGRDATATGGYAIAIGQCSATDAGAICISNEQGMASGAGATVIGPAQATASGYCSIAIGGTATASRQNELAFGFRHSLFDVRPGGFLITCKTTDNTPTTLLLRNIFDSQNFTTRSGTVLHGTLNVTGVKSDGSAVAIYTRRVVLKNVGGTITLVQSQTIGTDYEDNASTDLTVSGTSPFFQVTGIASETWRWAGWFNPTLEIAYGT
jgi:hypothetical protein